MSNVNKDRATLNRLVESYGKKDVLKYVNHLDEYMLGGNDWGDHTYNDNYYRKYGLANEDEIPYPAMNSLWFLGFFADKFRTILSNNLDPRKDNNRDIRDMGMQEIEYWDKVLDPIAGLMSNKTNIEGDEHQITKQDVLQYRSIYEKLLTSPVNLLQSSAQQLINFCKEISDSRRVGESVKTDRNKLKALVESYGKQDVLKFIKHLNEESEEGSDGDYIASMLNSMCSSPRYTRANQIEDISENISNESEEDSLLLDFADSWGLEDDPTWVTEEWRDEVLDVVYELSGYPCVYKLQSDAREYFWNEFQGNYPNSKELIDFRADNNLYYSILQYNVDNIAIYDFVCYDGDEELGGFTLVGTRML